MYENPKALLLMVPRLHGSHPIPKEDRRSGRASLKQMLRYPTYRHKLMDLYRGQLPDWIAKHLPKNLDWRGGR